MKKYRWYERLFFKLQFKEKKYFRIVFFLMVMIILVQWVLSNENLRRLLVLTEEYEGDPVQIQKNYKD